MFSVCGFQSKLGAFNYSGDPVTPDLGKDKEGVEAVYCDIYWLWIFYEVAYRHFLNNGVCVSSGLQCI